MSDPQDVKLQDLIRNALKEDSSLEAPEETIGSRVTDRFLGHSRWVAGFAWMKMAGTMTISIVAAALFFSADSTRSQIAWAALFTVGFVGFAMWWIWYWMVLTRNASLREIKRLELQIAELRALHEG